MLFHFKNARRNVLKNANLILAIALVCAGGFGASMTANAQDKPSTFNCNRDQACNFNANTASATTLNLSAQGEVKSAPDMASINFGVLTEGKTAEEAMRLNAAKMNSVFASLKKMGVADKNMMTSGLNLSAVYDYPNNQPAVLRGYQASNRVTIRIEELPKLGSTIDAVVKSGINQVDGIGFGLKDSSAAEDEARKSAIKILMARANLYASSLGLKVKRIKTLTESGGYSPQPMYKGAMERMTMSDSAPTPIAAGEMNVTISVSAEFELEK